MVALYVLVGDPKCADPTCRLNGRTHGFLGVCVRVVDVHEFDVVAERAAVRKTSHDQSSDASEAVDAHTHSHEITLRRPTDSWVNAK